MNLKQCHKATWVLQRVIQNHGISVHSDDFHGRKLAFVYYLTPDDWDNNIDGGALCVDSGINNKYEKINAQFNTLVAWNMNNQKSPLHYVETVRALNNRPRIALVGFFNSN